MISLNGLKMSQSQRFIAHQVNNPIEVIDLIDKDIGLEIDIAYSIIRQKWVVAHHDFDDVRHSSLENWFRNLTTVLNKAKSPRLHVIWLDIKTLDASLLSLVKTISKYIPKNIDLIYNLGQPQNILTKKHHKTLVPFLRTNDGVATWITKEQLSSVPQLAKELHKNNITNSIISYGELEEICKNTLNQLYKLNSSIINNFKKVFTWNVEHNNEIQYLTRQKDLNGQIIGYKKYPWDKNCQTKLNLFKRLNNNLTTNFWL